MKYVTASRRALATTLSGTLVAGAVAGTVIGASTPASAGDTQHDFDATCHVKVGTLDLGDHRIAFTLDAPGLPTLVPGSSTPRQNVDITLTMPETLQTATVQLIKATHAKGSSPDSAVNLTLPVHPALGGKVKERIAIKDLKAPKEPIPPVGETWEITSTGFVPKRHVPGFANGDGSSDAKLSLAPKFTIKSKLFTNKKDFISTMKCTVDKADRLVDGAIPVSGPYQTDTVPVQATTTARTKAKMQLVFFNVGPNPANSFTQPEHGKVTLDQTTGMATYTPNKNFAGTDSFTYTAKDDSGESTSKVTVKVKKAPTKLKVRAPKSITFGKPANVRVTVNSKGSTKGKVTLRKGKRVLDTAKVKGGKAKLTIKRKALKVGKHKLQVKYAGSKTAKKATKKITLRVKKR